MRKTLTLIASLAFALTAATAFAHHGPSDVKIDAAQKKQPAVMFPHGKHVAMVKVCDKCHHTNKGMTTEVGVTVQKCSTCHLDPKAPNVPSMREMSMTKNPFHMLCIDCHKTGKKGPTVCTQCHKK